MTNFDDHFDDDANETVEPSVDAALPEGGRTPIAYVRRLTNAEREQAPEAFNTDAAYALHDENGRPLALFADRDTALAVARANDLTPMSVH